jgi:hypothetical protein
VNLGTPGSLECETVDSVGIEYLRAPGRREVRSGRSKQYRLTAVVIYFDSVRFSS